MSSNVFMNAAIKVVNRAKQFFLIPSRVAKLEAGHTEILASIKNVLVTVEKGHTSLERSISDSESALRTSLAQSKADSDRNFARLDASVTSLVIRVDENSSGLGRGVEGMAIAWLEHLLLEKGCANVEILRNYIFNDDAELKNVEIDGYIPTMPLILEVTTSLKKNDGPKVDQFLKIKSVIERRTGKTVHSYFVVYNFEKKEHEIALKKAGVNVIDARLVWRDEMNREADRILKSRKDSQKQFKGRENKEPDDKEPKESE